MSENEVRNKNFYDICESIVRTLMLDPGAFYFFKPVEPEIDGAPDYFKYITHPMSFYVVQEKLSARTYKSPEEFIYDVKTIWSNAKYYNIETNPVYKAAEALSKKFDILALSLPRTVTQDESVSDLQKYVELRMKIYRQNKFTHL